MADLPVVAWVRQSVYEECYPVHTGEPDVAAEWGAQGLKVTPLCDHAAATSLLSAAQERIATLEARAEVLRTGFIFAMCMLSYETRGTPEEWFPQRWREWSLKASETLSTDPDADAHPLIDAAIASAQPPKDRP